MKLDVDVVFAGILVLLAMQFMFHTTGPLAAILEASFMLIAASLVIPKLLSR